MRKANPQKSVSCVIIILNMTGNQVILRQRKLLAGSINWNWKEFSLGLGGGDMDPEPCEDSQEVAFSFEVPRNSSCDKPIFFSP